MLQNGSLKIERDSGGAWARKFSPAGFAQAILDVLKRRWKVLLSVALLAFVLLGFLISSMQPYYSATTKIKLDPTRDALASGEEKLRAGAPDQVLVDTEVSVMKSREIASLVVQVLHLDRNPEFAGTRTSWAFASSDAKQQWLDRVADRVLRNLTVEREKGTYVVSLSYKAKRATDAARIANTFADAYIEKSLSARTGTASQQAAFLEKSVENLKKKLAASDAEFASYASKAGVMAGRGGGSGFSGTVTDTEIAPLTGQLASAESDAAAAASKLASARAQVAAGGLDSIGNVLESSVVTSLRNQRAEIAKELGDSASRYGPNHPITIEGRERAARVDQQIDAEARRIISSLASDAASAAARAASLRGQLAQLRNRQAENTRASVVATSLQLRSDTDRENYNREAEQYQRIVQLSRNTMTQAMIVEPASAQDSKLLPNKPLLFAIAFIFAGVLGAGVVTGQEVLTTGVRLPSDFESEFGIPFIVSVPKLKLGRGAAEESPADTIIDLPVSPFAEAFRIARSTLLNTGGKAPKIISMMSTLPGEGKTTSSLALARVMALSGERVLIIDCDLRQCGLTKAVGGEGKPGLVEILRNGVEPVKAIYADSTPGLDLITISSSMFTPEDMFGPRSRMAEFLEALAVFYDRIVLDCPPVLGVADARTLADLSDAAVLLVKWNSTPIASIHASLARFDGNPAIIKGAIFTMVDVNSEAIGAMYYSNKYAKYYQKS